MAEAKDNVGASRILLISGEAYGNWLADVLLWTGLVLPLIQLVLSRLWSELMESYSVTIFAKSQIQEKEFPCLLSF